jgi:hypothetical protein
MAEYAKNTKVPVGRSRIEIEKTLKRYGIDNFFFVTSPNGDGIGFNYNGRTIKYGIPLPKRDDFKPTQTGVQDYKRSMRQRYRVLVIALKAKLEMVDIGLTTFEDEFLAQTCLADGSTVGEFMEIPENIARLEKAKIPKLLTS